MSQNQQTLILALSLLAVSVGFAYRSRVSTPSVSKNTKPGEERQVSSVPVASVPFLIFPSVESRKLLRENFDNRSLALEFNQFIHPSAEEKSMYEFVYAGSNNTVLGFEISYQLIDGNLPQVYKEEMDAAGLNGWKILAANLEDDHAFIDVERKTGNTSFQVRLSLDRENELLMANVQFLISP